MSVAISRRTCEARRHAKDQLSAYAREDSQGEPSQRGQPERNDARRAAYEHLGGANHRHQAGAATSMARGRFDREGFERSSEVEHSGRAPGVRRRGQRQQPAATAPSLADADARLLWQPQPGGQGCRVHDRARACSQVRDDDQANRSPLWLRRRVHTALPDTLPVPRGGDGFRSVRTDVGSARDRRCWRSAARRRRRPRAAGGAGTAMPVLCAALAAVRIAVRCRASGARGAVVDHRQRSAERRSDPGGPSQRSSADTGSRRLLIRSVQCMNPMGDARTGAR